jgi:hypothetical protein
MTGTMHVADHQGDTTHTWDTADPRTVQEIEELFREAQATGRLVYARPATAAANRSASTAGTPTRTSSCSSPRGWPAANARP